VLMDEIFDFAPPVPSYPSSFGPSESAVVGDASLVCPAAHRALADTVTFLAQQPYDTGDTQRVTFCEFLWSGHFSTSLSSRKRAVQEMPVLED
jgi:hypothetical protein